MSISRTGRGPDETLLEGRGPDEALRIIELDQNGRHVPKVTEWLHTHTDNRNGVPPAVPSAVPSAGFEPATTGFCKGSFPSVPVPRRKRPPARHFHTPSYLVASRYFPTIFVINDE